MIKIRSIVSVGLMVCVLMPKFNLISIPGYIQGLRYDDIFLLIGVIYICLKNKIFLNNLPGGKDYFVFYGVILLYGIFSSYSYGLISIIIALRWIEYSVFYVLLFYSSLSYKNIRYFIIFYIAINLCVSILQLYGYVGGIYSHGYFSNVSSRISGITGGSWELPAILSLFIVPLIADKSFHVIYTLIIIFFASIPVYLSGTRTGMIVFFFSVLLSVIFYYKIKISNLILISWIGILFIGQVRMKLFNIDHIFFQSMLIRYNLWYVKYIEMDYMNYIFGMGLGYSGVHVDGMYAKIFLDCGILGLFLFFIYYYRLFRYYIIIGFIAVLYSVALDFFSASKIMFALYLSMYYLKMISEKNFINIKFVPAGEPSKIKE